MNEANILTVHSVIGDKVKNTEGEILGEIKELLIDPQSGKIEYGVLVFGTLPIVGEVLGIGHREIAVPYEALTLLREEDKFVLNVDKEVLESTEEKITYQGKEYYIY